MSKLDERKQKIINWFKNPYNIALSAIIVFSIIIRLKYYNINTGIWWDEGEYLVMAKKWAFGVMQNTSYWSGRSIIYPLIWAFFFKLGFNEVFIRFTTEFIPSVLSVYVVFLLGKEMYNKKIGLIAASLMSFFWLGLFMTARLLLDLPGLFFGTLAVYFFWKYYEKEKKRKFIVFAVIFSLISFIMRYSNGIFLLCFLIYLFVTKKLSFLKDKKMWKSTIIISIIFFPLYFIFNYITVKEWFPGLTTYLSSSSAIYEFDKPAYYIIKYFYIYLDTFLFIFFIVGLILMINVIIGFDLIIKQKEKKLNPDFFILLTLLLFFSIFIFVYKYAEPRYLIMTSVFMILIASKGIYFIFSKIKEYNKYVAIALITAIILTGGYTQLTRAHETIMNKKDSFSHIKMAGEWIKENSNQEDLILMNTNQMEFMGFAERDTRGISAKTPEELDKEIKEKNAKFIVNSWWFGGVDEWLLKYELENPKKFMLVQGFFFDEEKKKPGSLIFKVDPEKL